MKQLTKLDIHSQEVEFLKVLETNINIKNILERIKFPKDLNWYLVGGCLNQTIWNHTTGRKWNYGIEDYDIFYWDDDLAESKESGIQNQIVSQFDDLKCDFDVTNQSRVHKWFKSYFGSSMPGYSNLEQAVGSPPSTVTCVGVTLRNGRPVIYAPYGLGDIFSMKLRYNTETFIPDKFVIPKIEKWKQKWSELEIIKDSYPYE